MPEQKIDKDYKSLLRISKLRGETEERSGDGPERRTHPRIQVDTADIQVDTDSWIFVINLSVTGIAFYSDSAFEVGQTVTIAVEPDLKVPAKVVESVPEGEEAISLVGQYRVCCEFTDPDEGMAFLMELKKMEEGNLKLSPG